MIYLEMKSFFFIYTNMVRLNILKNNILYQLIHQTYQKLKSSNFVDLKHLDRLTGLTKCDSHFHADLTIAPLKSSELIDAGTLKALF